MKYETKILKSRNSHKVIAHQKKHKYKLKKRKKGKVIDHNKNYKKRILIIVIIITL